MTINSYTFRSPSPQQVQVGTLVPQKDATQNQDVDRTENRPNLEQEAKSYVDSISAKAQSSLATASSETSAAVKGFSDVNTQLEAVNAYTR